MNGILLLYQYWLSDGDTQKLWGHSNPTYCTWIHFNVLHSEATVGMLKHLAHARLFPLYILLSSGKEPPGESFTTYYFFR